MDNQPENDSPKKERFSSSAVLWLVVSIVILCTSVGVLVVVFCR